jgi:hypothetical protein
VKRWPEALIFAVVMALIAWGVFVLEEDCRSRGGVLRPYAGCIAESSIR